MAASGSLDAWTSEGEARIELRLGQLPAPAAVLALEAVGRDLVQELAGLVAAAHPELVGALLVPRDAALGASDEPFEAVLAGRARRCKRPPLRRWSVLRAAWW